MSANPPAIGVTFPFWSTFNTFSFDDFQVKFVLSLLLNLAFNCNVSDKLEKVCVFAEFYVLVTFISFTSGSGSLTVTSQTSLTYVYAFFSSLSYTSAFNLIDAVPGLTAVTFPS